MALLEGQVHIAGGSPPRDLLLGPDTPYEVNVFNRFRRTVRAAQGGPRPRNHGSWSGAEWRQELVIRMVVVTSGDLSGGMASWMELDQQLAAALAPVADTGVDVELRHRLGGREYTNFGRPRSVLPDDEAIGWGWSAAEIEFVAPDPVTYSAEEVVSDPVPLPRFTGGLAVPPGGLMVPLLVEQTRVGGELELINEGTKETGLMLRIDGPVPQPRVTLQRADGVVQTLRWRNLELPAGQFLDVDTAARTAFLNGLSQAGQHPGFTDWPLVPPGTSRLLFDAADRTAGGTMTTRHRHGWW